MTLIAEIKRSHANTLSMKSDVAANSLAAVDGKLVTLTAGVVALAGVGSRMAGVCKSTKTFASDNITVAKLKCLYVPEQDQLEFKMTTDATIVQADVNKAYGINADQTVDVATGTATKTSLLNLRLVEVINTTTGIFKIDNDMV